MIRRTLLISVFSLLASPCASQFGIAQKKRGTTFEDLNDAAKENFEEVDVDALGNMKNLGGAGGAGGFGDLSQLMGDMMNDPSIAKLMKEANTDVEGALEELKKLTPDQFASQMQEAMSFLTSGDMLDKVLDNKDAVIENLKASGLIDEKTLEEMTNNPEKLEADMKAAFGQMKDMFSDPEAMKTVTDIAKGITDVLKNPDKLVDAMNSMSGYDEVFKDLEDDDKIEEARLQLLNDPELAGNPILKSVYESEEMKAILKDPVKWRETVKKGQGMLTGDKGAAMEA